MKRSNWHPKLGVTVALLSLMLGFDGVLSSTAIAQFTSPPGQGTPKGTAAGGSRPSQSPCFQPGNQDRPIPLAPTKSVGLTANATPTVWVHLPKTTARSLEFSLLTNQEGVYQANLSIRSTGLVALQLPANIKLEAEQPYTWTVSLICDPAHRSRDWVMEGAIQYQIPTVALQKQLMDANATQRIKLYLQAGFWYEALNAYLNLGQQSPQPNLASLWTELLKAAELPTIAVSSSATISQ